MALPSLLRVVIIAEHLSRHAGLDVLIVDNARHRGRQAQSPRRCDTVLFRGFGQTFEKQPLFRHGSKSCHDRRWGARTFHMGFSSVWLSTANAGGRPAAGGWKPAEETGRRLLSLRSGHDAPPPAILAKVRRARQGAPRRLESPPRLPCAHGASASPKAAPPLQSGFPHPTDSISDLPSAIKAVPFGGRTSST